MTAPTDPEILGARPVGRPGAPDGDAGVDVDAKEAVGKEKARTAGVRADEAEREFVDYLIKQVDREQSRADALSRARDEAVECRLVLQDENAALREQARGRNTKAAVATLLTVLGGVATGTTDFDAFDAAGVCHVLGWFFLVGAGLWQFVDAVLGGVLGTLASVFAKTRADDARRAARGRLDLSGASDDGPPAARTTKAD